MDTKSSNNKFTLLQFLVSHLKKHSPHLLQFYEELSSVPFAARGKILFKLMVVVSNGNMSARIKHVRNRIRSVAKQVEECQKYKIPNDQFPHIMTDFVVKATYQIEIVEEKNEKMIKALKELAILFDEDENLMLNTPGNFFENINIFIEQFKTAEKQLLEAQMKSTTRKQKKSTTNPLQIIADSMFNGQIFRERREKQVYIFDDLIL